jgi:hypothetical protein
MSKDSLGEQAKPNMSPGRQASSLLPLSVPLPSMSTAWTSEGEEIIEFYKP